MSMATYLPGNRSRCQSRSVPPSCPKRRLVMTLWSPPRPRPGAASREESPPPSTSSPSIHVGDTFIHGDSQHSTLLWPRRRLSGIIDWPCDVDTAGMTDRVEALSAAPLG